MRISIITVCKNAEKLLRGTMDSVLSQTYPDIEYIVIDGASTDGTVELLQEYEQRVQSSHDSRLTSREFRWISEPDSGIYAAMNKGIGMSTGEVMVFLNAGDTYVSLEMIDHVMGDMRKTEGLVFSGSIVILSPDGRQGEFYNIIDRSFDNKKEMFRLGLAHPATFYKRSVFKELGYYDEKFKIAGDLEFHMRIVSAGIKIHKIDRHVAIFLNDGISSSGSFEKLRCAENETIRRRYSIPEVSSFALREFRRSVFSDPQHIVSDLKLLLIFLLHPPYLKAREFLRRVKKKTVSFLEREAGK